MVNNSVVRDTGISNYSIVLWNNSMNNIYSYTNPPGGFYVYAYIRSKDSKIASAGTPYYIGKGCKERAWATHHKKNKGIRKPNDNFFIIVLESNLTEIGAFALERRMIRWYGRKDLGTGILNNRTDGGDGASGRPGPKTPWTEERKKIVSEKLKGRKRPRTAEHQKKLNDSLQNRGRNNESSYEKCRETVKTKYQNGYVNPASKKIKVTDIDTGTIIITYGIKTWAVANNFNPNTVDWSYRKKGYYKNYLIEVI